MLKKVIKALIIILIISIIIVGVLLYIEINKVEEIKETYGVDEIGITEIKKEDDHSIQLVTNRNDFYIVKTCIYKFYTNYILICEDTESKENKDLETMYNFLDEKYIQFKQVTKDNVLNVLPEIKDSIINITDMKVSKQSNSINIYIAKGTLREKVSGKIVEFEIMVQLDLANKTFSIFLEDYIQKNYNNLKIGENLNITIPTEIKSNGDNIYENVIVTDEEYVLDLFSKYKEEVLYNRKLAYEHLDEEYRNKKFGSLEKFEEYAKNNVRKNVIAKIEKYEKTITDDYTQYVCIDQNGKYYIFRDKSIMNYSLILDTYTIDLPEAIEKYNSYTSMEKAGYNVQKCMEAINEKDYSYVYDKLEVTFKEKNYKTEEDFIKEIKKNLFANNKVESVSSLNEGYTYIFKLNIVDEENNKNKKDMTIIMQLTEGMNFKMSFSFN